MNILFLEDDAETAATILEGLRSQGIEVVHAGDAPTTIELAASRRFDAAILDIIVPGGSGLDVLTTMRAEGVTTPVLLLTARDTVEDRVRGLELGADDYLVKPFAFAELLARVRALLRRPEQRVDPIRIAQVEIDPLHRSVVVGEQQVDLSKRQFDLLLCLAERRGEVLARPFVLERVWGYRFDPGTNVVDVHVNRLRRKLETAGASSLIRTVRGVGYVVD